jgi:copper chaperone CopZ
MLSFQLPGLLNNYKRVVMKSILLSIIAALAFAQMAQAQDVTVKISDVHLCCGGCLTGVSNAVSGIDGVKATADKESRVVEITGPNTAAVQSAADALVKAGFFGVSSDPSIKISSDTGAKGVKVQSLKVEGVHLCCPKCVKAVNAALSEVPGVTGNTAEKNAKVFIVTGDFTDADVFAALQKIGLTGHVGQ